MSNPQVNLNAAFPGAVAGDAVLDEATGDYWYYDGGTWQNVGSRLGEVASIENEITPWNEVLSVTGNSLIQVRVKSIPYSLEPVLTELEFGVNISVTAFEAGSASPDAVTIQVQANVPEIVQGIAVFVDYREIQILALDPTVDAKLGVTVKPSVTDIQIQGATGVDISTTSLEVFVGLTTVTIDRFSPTVSAVLDPFFSQVKLLIKSVGEVNTTTPAGRFFPDLGPLARTVRVTEYTRNYYNLLDNSPALQGPGDPLYDSTVLLFQPDGPQGSTTFTDLTGKITDFKRVGPSRVDPATDSTVIITNTVGGPVTGTSYSAYFDGALVPPVSFSSQSANFIKGTLNPAYHTLNEKYCIEIWFYPLSLPTVPKDLGGGATDGAVPLITAYFDNNNFNNTFNLGYYVKYPGSLTAPPSGMYGGTLNGLTFPDIENTGIPVINQWNHVVLQNRPTSFGLDQQRVYLNGKLIGLQNIAPNASLGNSVIVYIGGSTLTSYAFNGYIGSIRITKDIRYNTDYNITTPGATAYTIPTQKFPTFQGSPYQGSVIGNLASWTDGLKGVIYSSAAYKFNSKSILFHSKTSWLQASYAVNEAFGNGPFTMEAWIRFTELSTTQQWLFNNLAINSVTVELVNIDLGSSVPHETVTWNHGGSIAVGSWLHIAVARDTGHTLRLFVNGTQVDTNKTMTNGTFTTPVYMIGSKYYVSGVAQTNTLRAFLQEIRITNNVRYTANFSVPTETFPSLSLPLPNDEAATIPSSATQLLVPGYIQPGGANLKDFSANNSTITPVFTPGTSEASTSSVEDPFGTFRSVIKLQSGGYYTIGGNSNLVFNKNPFCVEFWIYFTGHPTGDSTATSGCYILDGAPTTSPRLLIDWDDAINGYHSNAVFGQIKGESFALGSSFAEFGNHLRLNRWYHVAYTRDSLGEARLFIDGKILGSPQFLHNLDANYTWTGDGYQNFTTALNSIGVNQSNSPNYSRKFNGYIAEISVISGYAKYLSNFTPPTGPFPLATSGIQLTSNALVAINAQKPNIVAGTPYVVNVTSASAGAGSTLTLALPSGTTTNDVTYVLISYPRNAVPATDPSLLGNDLTALSWTRETVEPANYSPLLTPRIYVWNKVFSSAPLTNEQTLKLSLPVGTDPAWKGSFVRTDNTNLVSYTTKETAPDRTVTPSTIVAKAERNSAGNYVSGTYSGTTCDGTFTKTDVLSDGLNSTWITTARNTIGSMWMHCGINWTPEGCCTVDVCGVKIPNKGVVNNSSESLFDSFVNYGKYIRIRVAYCRTNWDGTTLNAAGNIFTGGSTSNLRYSGFGVKSKPSEPSNAFLTTTLGSIKSLYENSFQSKIADTRFSRWLMPTGANGEIRYATFWVSHYDIQQLIDRHDYANSAAGGYYGRLQWYNYIPGVLFGYEGGGGGPSARSGVGIVSLEMDHSPTLKFQPRYVLSSVNNLRSNTGVQLNTTCTFGFTKNFETILTDNNTSTFIAGQSGFSSVVEWHSGGTGTSGLYDCCTGGTVCDGDQVWDIPWRGDQLYDNYNGFKSGDFLRFTVTIVRAFWNGNQATNPVVKIGGAQSSIQLTAVGWMNEWTSSSSSTNVPSWLTTPVLVTDSNGQVVTYTFDVQLWDSVNAPNGWVAPLWGSPFKAVWSVTNGGTSGSGTESSVGIVDMSCQLIPNGYTGPVNVEGVTAHAVTVRNTSSGFKTAVNLSSPSYSDFEYDLVGSRANPHCKFQNSDTSTQTTLPIPLAIKKNSLWINYTVTNRGRDTVGFGTFPSTTQIENLTIGSVVGVTGAVDQTKAVASRLAYGSKPALAGAAGLVQTFTGQTSSLSLSLVIDNLTTDRVGAVYLAQLEQEDGLYDGLIGNSTYESALSTLIETMRTTGLTKVLPLVGFRNISYVRELNSLTSASTAIDDIRTLFPKRDNLFKNFKLTNPSVGISYSELYAKEEPDYSVAYGIRGNPTERAHIQHLLVDYTDPTFYPIRYSNLTYPTIIISKPPNLSTWKGGTKKTCKTEYFGYGEGLMSSGTTRLLTKCFSENSTRGPATTVFFINTSTENSSYIYGEIGFTQAFSDKKDPFELPAAIDLVSYPLTDDSSWFVQHLVNSSCVGSYPSAYRYGYISYGLKTQSSSITNTSTTSNACLDICGGDFISYPCPNHRNNATAYLMNGRDELVNPAYSSARVGALVQASQIYQNQSNTTTINAAVITYMNAIKSILLA